ncbi:MAG: methyl-accepting chemotaxis protein [Pseudomonadota bacterium]
MLIGDIDALDLANKINPNSNGAIGHVGRARGHALSIGILALLCATAADDDERLSHAADLIRVRDLYIESVREAARLGAARIGDRVREERAIVHDFAARIAELPLDGRLDRDAAAALAQTAREAVLPAIYSIVSTYQTLEMEDLQASIDRLADKAKIVDRLLSEIERIARLIGFISINASVEAARTGGVAGRAFQFIAEEVRNLARQTSDMLEQTRERLKQDHVPRGAVPPAITLGGDAQEGSGSRSRPG